MEASEDQIADFKEAFSLFDKDGDSRIKTSELGLLVRSLNQNPTEAEIKEYISEVDPDNTGTLSFSDFVALRVRKMKDIDAEEELLEAFAAIENTGSGFIGKEELKHMVSNIGEKLTEEEAEKFIKIANPDGNGNINVEEFVRILSNKLL